MATTLRFWRYFQLQVNGVTHKGGHLSTPVTVSLDGDVFDVTNTIAATTTWDAWTSGAEQSVTDFDFLYIESELDDVLVELTIDNAGDVGDEIITIQLKKDIPLILGSDTGYANYTADFAGGTLDVIDRIRIRNPSSASTAAVRVLLAT